MATQKLHSKKESDDVGISIPHVEIRVFLLNGDMISHYIVARFLHTSINRYWPCSINNNGTFKLKAQSHDGKGKLDYIIIISMIKVSLERGRIGCGTVLVMYFWLKPYLKFWSFWGRLMHVWRLLRTRLETSNQRNFIDRTFSCLPTHSCG